MWWLVVAALLPLQPADAAAAATTPGPACPRSCRCSGDVTQLECVGAQLPAMTSAAALAVTSLAVSGLELAALEKRHLWGFANLQSLTLSNGRISEISTDAFSNLSRLLTLDLSRNNVTEIPAEMLKQNVLLRRLILSGNHIELPSAGPLVDCLSLQYLDISRCGVSRLPAGVFSGTPHLLELHVQDNYLRTYPTDALKKLRSLKVLWSDTFTPEGSGCDIHEALPMNLRQIVYTSLMTVAVASVLLLVYKTVTSLVKLFQAKEAELDEPSDYLFT